MVKIRSLYQIATNAKMLPNDNNCLTLVSRQSSRLQTPSDVRWWVAWACAAYKARQGETRYDFMGMYYMAFNGFVTIHKIESDIFNRQYVVHTCWSIGVGISGILLALLSPILS